MTDLTTMKLDQLAERLELAFRGPRREYDAIRAEFRRRDELAARSVSLPLAWKPCETDDMDLFVGPLCVGTVYFSDIDPGWRAASRHTAFPHRSDNHPTQAAAMSALEAAVRGIGG